VTLWWVRIFADEDGDGWEEARIYDFGPGDTVEVPAEAWLAADGLARWRFSANAEVTVTLPGGQWEAIFLDGIELPSAHNGAKLRAMIPVSALAEGRQTLEVKWSASSPPEWLTRSSGNSYRIR
jgi:hypothetical protein